MARATIENNYAEEGDYHGIVNRVENHENDQYPNIAIELGILAGTTPGQEGKVHNEKIFLNGKELFVVAHACGLLSDDELKTIIANKGGEFDENQLEGCQLCFGLRKELNKKTNKEYTKAGQRFWGLGSEEAKHIPKDAESIALVMPEGIAPAGQTAPAAAPVQQAAPPAAAKPNPFAGIGKGARKPAATAGAA